MAFNHNLFNEYKKERRAAIKWGVWAVAFLFLMSLSGGVFYIISAPSRVLQKTMATGNIIHNYEWFHDTNNAFISRLAQIKSHKKAMSNAGKNADRLDRYRIEIEAMRQSCRDMAAKYNANSTKTNRSIFKGKTAPPWLAMSQCEV